METQQILFGFCPKLPSSPSFSIAKQFFSLKFPPLPSSPSPSPSYPFIKSQNLGVPRGAFLHPISIAHKEECCRKRRIWCNCSSSSAEPNEVRGEVTVRRKMLAVFVSDGGSKFRSIHEAFKKGSLHGDVVVSITNKSGNGLLPKCPFTFIVFLLLPN